MRLLFRKRDVDGNWDVQHLKLSDQDIQRARQKWLHTTKQGKYSHMLHV